MRDKQDSSSEDSLLPDWKRLLAAERQLQLLVPGTVMVRGTAVALHAGHRMSRDADHVPEDLRDRFDEVLEELESVAGWSTARVRRPVLILGRLEGIETGIRQLRRTRPLETETILGLRVPTLPEMARIKAWLLATGSRYLTGTSGWLPCACWAIRSRPTRRCPSGRQRSEFTSEPRAQASA